MKLKTVGESLSARYLTQKYDVYAAYILEKHAYLTRLPKTQKGKKVFYEISKALPTLEEYRALEDEFFRLDGLSLLCGVYRDLMALSRRSLRRGGALLSLKSGEDALESVEGDMLFLENRAKEIESIIQENPELENSIFEYRPDPRLLYPTRGWPMRRVVLGDCLVRLNTIRNCVDGVEEIIEDFKTYEVSWWRRKE